MSDFERRWQRLVSAAREAPEPPAPAQPDLERLLARVPRRAALRPPWRWTPGRLVLAASLALACYPPSLLYADRALAALPRVAQWTLPAPPTLPPLSLPPPPRLPAPPRLPDPQPLLAKLLPSDLPEERER